MPPAGRRSAPLGSVCRNGASVVSIRPARLTALGGARSGRLELALEVVEATPVDDPVARQPHARRAKSPLRARERRTGARACPAPARRLRSSRRPARTMACPSRNAATENSIGIVGHLRRPARRPRTACRPLLKTLLTIDGLHDPRQVVGAQHPLVVAGDDVARRREALACPASSSRASVDHAVVEADHRQVRLRHREVLVVALVGDEGLPLLGPAARARPRAAGRSRRAPGSARTRSRRSCRSSDAGRRCRTWPTPDRPGRRRRASPGPAPASALHERRGGTLVPSVTSILSKMKSWSANWPEVRVARPGCARSRRRPRSSPGRRAAAFGSPSWWPRPFGPMREKRKAGTGAAAGSASAASDRSALAGVSQESLVFDVVALDTVMGHDASRSSRNADARLSRCTRAVTAGPPNTLYAASPITRAATPARRRPGRRPRRRRRSCPPPRPSTPRGRARPPRTRDRGRTP